MFLALALRYPSDLQSDQTQTHSREERDDAHEGEDGGDDREDAPDDRVAELDLGQVGEGVLQGLGRVEHVEQQQAGRDEEGRPEDEAQEAGAEEDVDDPAHDGEDLRGGRFQIKARARFPDQQMYFCVFISLTTWPSMAMPWVVLTKPVFTARPMFSNGVMSCLQEEEFELKNFVTLLLANAHSC